MIITFTVCYTYVLRSVDCYPYPGPFLQTWTFFAYLFAYLDKLGPFSLPTQRGMESTMYGYNFFSSRTEDALCTNTRT